MVNAVFFSSDPTHLLLYFVSISLVGWINEHIGGHEIKVGSDSKDMDIMNQCNSRDRLDFSADGVDFQEIP